jgi:hypothetical protein
MLHPSSEAHHWVPTTSNEELCLIDRPAQFASSMPNLENAEEGKAEGKYSPDLGLDRRPNTVGATSKCCNNITGKPIMI